MTAPLQDWATQRALELPGAAEEWPFGPEHLVVKVRGKMFLLVSARDDSPFVTVKARPADGTVLQEAFAEITPGYHMNKRHWISLRAGGALTEELVRDLVTESYLLVVEGLPRAERPVNPDTFGQPGGSQRGSADAAAAAAATAETATADSGVKDAGATDAAAVGLSERD